MNRIEAVKKILLDFAYGKYNTEKLNVEEQAEWKAKLICQLFPQPLPDPNCPKCGGKGWLTEMMELHGMSHPMGVVCDCVKSQPLDDKELTKEIQDIVWEYKCDEANLFDSEMIVKRILALLQPKIEEAEKRGIDTAIKAYESTCESLIVEARRQGRILGVKQASAFVRRAYDNPVIASEAEKWVIPYGYRFMSAIKTANRQALKGGEK